MSGHGHHGPGHGHDDHGPIEGRNKTIALLIAVIALFLAFAETLGKSAQTEALSLNIEASNLWNFFQAKTIRITTLATEAEALALESATTADPAKKAAYDAQIKKWRDTAARYQDEADPPEGRKQLMARAKVAEEKRDKFFAKYHHFEVSSAAFQIGIVLASSTVITGMIALTYIAAGLGILGIFFMGIGLFAPHAIHLF
ncbi:hypothetical protein GJW-30_1_01239 [Variibacter gotjawalensis]|uniref:DUF4337 domain-containing protein n=1 Tax=Variibacter gotjawalensis TaxID=1333996 RepID=A0A0S3PRX9_9BRAD|nr:DUF4337 domain-containing protein [Variibacter gotjawalensis]NIK49022.1 hypothetical protein [Variibacter gotjawalensis]RZS50878.1 uncharacterized protein DUF4337 [Variibacter gotjawalensis]BAT58712.1 hypothetical protein GJW-30_1_01239 [Variibacter gotjawalensis]